jgi:hypothetical protein
MVDSVNSSVPLGPSPENAVSREDFLSYMGMHLFAQMRMDLNLKDLFVEEHKQPGFLGRCRFFFIHEHRDFDPHILYEDIPEGFQRHCGEGSWEKLLNACSKVFAWPEVRKEADHTPLSQIYYSQFNVGNLFSRRFYTICWHRRCLKATDFFFAGFLTRGVGNAHSEFFLSPWGNSKPKFKSFVSPLSKQLFAAGSKG